METSRDDFVIAIRSAFLKKETQQKFSILTLIIFSIIFLILGEINFKPINYIKIAIKEIAYRSSFIVSGPEKIIGIGLNDQSTEVLVPLVVSFLPPENLIITLENDLANNFQINISATADYATMFEVYFGDAIDEVPTPLMLDETISHIYSEVGEYEVRVIALSGIDGA